MKLISLYIENFGGLSRYGLDFEDGLTVIEEVNGFGKTTLAEFIRAMFYGFPRKAKTLDKSRRQKYTPWNGGKFGGNLVFETEGVRYRVERSFGATPKGDSFTLIDLTTNKKSSRYSEELGLELFQLDGDSFERSTYMPQLSDGQVLTTDSIRSKLSNLVEDTNDVGNFEKAMAALKTRRSTFVPYRGSGGSVMQANSRISQLQEQLQTAESQRQTLEACGGAIENLEQSIDETRQKLDQIRRDIRRTSEAAAAAAVHGQHRRLEAQLRRTIDARRELEEKYPAGIPGWEEIEAARQEAARLEILHSRVVTEQDDLDAAVFLEANCSRFENHIPTTDELTDCRNQCQQVSDIREKTMVLAASLTCQPEVKVNALPLILCLILALAGAVPGAVLLLRQIYLWGGVALGVGALALIGAVVAAVCLTTARRKLQQFQQAQSEIHEEMDRLAAEAEALTGEIEAFLRIYGAEEGTDFYDRLAQLEHDSEDYLEAKERVSRWQQEKADHENQVAQCRSALNAFFEKASMMQHANIRSQLLQIRDDRKDWEEILRDESREAGELEVFRQEHEATLAQTVPETAVDLQMLHREEAELSRKQSASTEELLRQRQHRELLQTQVQQIPQLRDELLRWQEKKTGDQKKADLLDDTMALLEQAKENLSGSFMGPIRASFEGYLNRLWNEQAGGVLVTPDLEVQLERGGAAREMGYFSAGQADSVMLCLRLALVDALFAVEKPFVILDDPFVNLDDERTQQALELLKELSENRQILYLTCNSSRIPK